MKNSDTNKVCCCHKIPEITHELTQSLLVMYSYIKGCEERIKNDALDFKQLLNALQKMNKQVNIMAHKIQELI